MDLERYNLKDYQLISYFFRNCRKTLSKAKTKLHFIKTYLKKLLKNLFETLKLINFAM